MPTISIYRAERFSPNSIDRDKAIMDAVADIKHCDLRIREEEIARYTDDISNAGLILSMARGSEALAILQSAERSTIVVNNATSLVNCSRSRIESLMRDNNIPAAPLDGNAGWWIKRGDQAAQTCGDVRFAATANERDAIIGGFHARGIHDLVVTAHVEGDLLKFYGVADTDFFHTCYPTDGSFSKFGDEKLNGNALHTPFCRNALHTDATRLARLTGIMIYGGDCIVRADGSYAIIDFNDWPSFSACRRESAEAIAGLTNKLKEERNGYIQADAAGINEI